MSDPIQRKSHKTGFGPAALRETEDIPIAKDNCVCGVCGASMGSVNWIAVSSPKKKGILVFACREHVGAAMNLLGKLIANVQKVPEDLKLPDEEHN